MARPAAIAPRGLYTAAVSGAGGQPDPGGVLASRTTTKLLDALSQRGQEAEPAWAQIDARYRPVIAGLARRMGAPHDMAEEIGQQTLAEFVAAYRLGKYDRSKGRLSSWILGIARNTTLKAFRQSRRDHADHGDPSVLAGADEQALRRAWTDERDRVILHRAMSALRERSSIDDRTLTAFELVALRRVPAEEAAAQCAMSVEQVYVARSRVTKSLRAAVEQMTEAFEEDL